MFAFSQPLQGFLYSGAIGLSQFQFVGQSSDGREG